MDHGSHTFYLAFEWLGSYPTAITARAATLGPFDTEDDFSCSLQVPDRDAPRRTCRGTPGVRKVLYTLHGERGAIRVEDDDVELAVQERAGAGGATTWTFERQAISSDWMDSSHVTWFNSLFDDFKARHRARASSWAARRRRPSSACSSSRPPTPRPATDSRELPLPGLAALAGDDVVRSASHGRTCLRG